MKGYVTLKGFSVSIGLNFASLAGGNQGSAALGLLEIWLQGTRVQRPRLAWSTFFDLSSAAK